MKRRLPADSLDRRRAGILLHLTSLPGPGPCGSLGPDAYRFVDFLAGCGMSVWQMLPVGPTQSDGSPYQTSSAHAGSPRLIALEPLVERGWLESAAGGRYRRAPSFAPCAGPGKDSESGRWRRIAGRFAGFTEENAYWLDDYACFGPCARSRNSCWWEWPEPLRGVKSGPGSGEAAPWGRTWLTSATSSFCSSRNGSPARACQRVGVKLFGDMPIFVAHDSAEVWANPWDFDLREDGSPRVVAGVPPDYFSATGQRWGNPSIVGTRCRPTAFASGWTGCAPRCGCSIWCASTTFGDSRPTGRSRRRRSLAVNGRWVKALGDELFERLHQRFGPLPLIAEDLGVITDAVEALRKKYRLPGMKVLQFAFSGESSNPYLPFRHGRDSVVYTGTHDNDTTLGWYLSLNDSERAYVDEYLGQSPEDMPWPLIRCALGSRSHLAIVPMQDVLGLDGDHRMNLPGTTARGTGAGASRWDQVEPELSDRVGRLVRLYGR